MIERVLGLRAGEFPGDDSQKLRPVQTMTYSLRLATPKDAASILAIYSPIVETSTISFEFVPPTLKEMEERIAHLLPRLPWLVCEAEQMVWGYAYASPHRVRAAYQWSVDVSAYVHPQARQRGVGRALYTALFKILALQGYFKAYAGITQPNPASVGFHEALGFEFLCIYRQVGFKMGAWRDVGWWELPLQERVTPPQPPLDLTTAMAHPQWEATLTTGLR